MSSSVTDSSPEPECYEAWSTPSPDQVEVMLVGTYHMANPGLDKHDFEADDVLTPTRQRELRDLVARLERWSPDHVAVEQPYDRQETVDSAYRDYRNDGLEDRNEVVQVGFRLADRLGHDRVHAVDVDMSIEVDDEAPWTEEFDSPEKLDYARPNLDERVREKEERLRNATVREYLRWLNREPQLREVHELMFEDCISWGAGDGFEGARLLAGWYERNLRTVQNLWRIVEDTDERVFLLIGASHVRVLRHLLDEAPMFCPVSPRPYLSDREERPTQ